MLKVGEVAPEFDLRDQNDKQKSLGEYKGKWLVIYFYPKDDTPGCTKEACGIRDSFGQLSTMAEVVGISRDSVKSHKKFADKYGLPFTLLSDPEAWVIKAYGAWGKKEFMGREFEGILRITYLVDPQGKIAKVYPDVKPEGHAEELTADLKKLNLA